MTTPPVDYVELSLEQAATHLLEECRMVLPGIQALLGFQLVAVFSTGFDTKLTSGERMMHLGAILGVVVAVALVMSPAALHRLRQPERVSRGFLQLSTRLLMWSMVPLGAGLSLDVYVVARAISANIAVAIGAAALSVASFVALWMILPARAKL
jgi:hypothetical protein